MRPNVVLPEEYKTALWYLCFSSKICICENRPKCSGKTRNTLFTFFNPVKMPDTYTKGVKFARFKLQMGDKGSFQVGDLFFPSLFFSKKKKNVLEKWFSAIRHPPSAIRHPPSAIRHPPSAIRHPPSAIRHPPSAIRHPPSAIRHPPSAVRIHPSVSLFYMRVPFQHIIIWHARGLSLHFISFRIVLSLFSSRSNTST